MLIENVTSHLKNHTHAYGALLGMILVVLGVFLYTNKINSISTAVTEQQVAQITYKPLTDLFTLGSLTSTADTVGYLQKMIFFVIGLAIVLAILMIVWGGIQYMASEAFTEKQDAVNRMTMALFGLIIALGAYLLLNIINPRLVVIDLEIKDTRNVVGAPVRPPAPQSNPSISNRVIVAENDAEGSEIVIESLSNQPLKNRIVGRPVIFWQDFGVVTGLRSTQISDRGVAIQQFNRDCQTIKNGGEVYFSNVTGQQGYTRYVCIQ